MIFKEVKHKVASNIMKPIHWDYTIKVEESLLNNIKRYFHSIYLIALKDSFYDESVLFSDCIYE